MSLAVIGKRRAVYLLRLLINNNVVDDIDIFQYGDGIPVSLVDTRAIVEQF